MPGFLGGGGGGGGAGGEISFPKELIDPVTKIRVSQPETMIDTDFEYGLQPTKWETVELINNTPSFFSKSGDTTIPGILSITTNARTREITVKTEIAHGLAAGIPINVTGSKSITADGAYIINSIPDTKTFTYFCKDVQNETSAIEDLYTSIVTGEFFQGSQIKISDSAGIVTDAAEPISTLTVTTDSTHGFGVKTPFYFLNLNSIIAQNFDATNTSSKSFDSSNSATAQTFDGSNTLSTLNIDYSNSATVGGTRSSITNFDSSNNTIVVQHTAENFVGLPLATPLYYDISTAAGFFSTSPRGVVFLKTFDQLGTQASTFSVSGSPDGEIIPIPSALSGSFQIANQARTFAGNNVNLETQQSVEIVNETPIVFDASNTAGTAGTVTNFSGSLVAVSSNSGQADLNWYFGSMVRYTVTGTAASGLVNGATYFIDQFFPGSTSGSYFFTLRQFPDTDTISSITGNTSTSTHVFTQIGVSIDKDIIHIFNNGLNEKDMVRYDFPAGGRLGVETVDEQKLFYFVSRKYDAHNLTLNPTLGELNPKTININVDRGTTIEPTTATPVGLTAPITFAITSGTLPSGLSLNSTTGSVTGTPVEAIPAPGREVIITATDPSGSTAFQTQTYIINATVGSINPPTISRQGTDAQFSIAPTTATTVNLVAPITWAISSGTLPTGLSFNTSNGVVSGTPTEVIASAREVIIRATDVGGLQGFQTHTYQFNQPPFLYSFSSATFTSGGASGRNGPNISQARNGVGNPSWANQYLNMNTQGIQLWTVPDTANYRIQAFGAGGARCQITGQSGGTGVSMRGDFALTEGEIVGIIVGQGGVTQTNGWGSGSGGGGSFVWRQSSTNLPMVAAGGGGAGGQSDNDNKQATTSTSGRNGSHATFGNGGSNGNVGGGGSCTGGGGSGWYGGNTETCGGTRTYGNMWQDGRGLDASSPGSFGGSGGSHGGSGGGGGFSGGGAGGWSLAGMSGGGGSFNSGSNQSNSTGQISENQPGRVFIQKL